jgi:hypothetical protein
LHEPNEKGECLFEGSVPAIPGGAPAVWLEVEERAKAKRIIIDDVVAQPAPPGMSTRSLNLATKTKAPLRQPFVSDWLRKHRRFGLPPKTGPEMPLPSLSQRLRER